MTRFLKRPLPTFLLSLLSLCGAGVAAAQEGVTLIPQEATVERDGLLTDRDTGVPITGAIVARREDGRLSRRFSVVDGRADGAWLEWHETGAVSLYAEWKRGLGDGVWVYFHPNGEIRERAQVRDDVWNGVAEGWHENGVKAFEGRFDMGVRPGPVRRWTSDGTAVGPWVDLAGGAERRAVLAEGWPAGTPSWDFSFTPDMETAFIATGNEDGSARRILVRRWRNGAWTPPEPAPFADAAASEGTPIVSPDGRHVYFSSDRHRATEPDNPHRDLYRASAASGWRTVERVTATPAYGEVSLSLSADGRGALWTGRRLDGEPRMGLYEIRLGPGDPAGIAVVRALNDLHVGDPSNENYAAMSADGRAMIFANYDVERPGTDEDLYLTCRTADGWSPPVSLGAAVNTTGTESSPQFIDEGRTLAWRHQAVGVFEIRVIALPPAVKGCLTD